MKNNKQRSIIKAGWLLFYLYILTLSYFLFFSERYGRDFIAEEYRYNLEFLKEIKRFIKYREYLGQEKFMVNILGNVLAFAPFGFMLPLLCKRYRKFLWIIISIIIMTLSAELIQLVFKVGIFDVDDLFLNTIGGILGYLVYRITNFIYERCTRQSKGKD